MALEKLLRDEPAHRLSPARAELLQTMLAQKLSGGSVEVKHPWKETCMLAQAFRHNVPLTVHPGIGYDIISNHPIFNGAVIGRAGELQNRARTKRFRALGRAAKRYAGKATSPCCRQPIEATSSSS